MAQVASPQGKEEKAKVDQGLFLQLPYILIDTLNMSDSASLGFIRLCRQCLQKDKTIRYSGSYRQLAAYIQQSRMTCYRSVEQWVKAGLVTKTETPDEFILTGDLSALWSKNSDHCKTHQRPKVGQSINTSASQSGTSKAEQRPTLTSTASQDKHNSVPTFTENKHKTGDIYTLGDTSVDTFFGAPSEASYSQEMEQPTEEKKEEPIVSHMAEWLADLDTRMDALDQEYLKDCSHRSWLQETSMQPETASQAPSEEKKPLPDGPLSIKPDIPNVALTPKQQEALRKQRMVDIMALADKEVGARVPRSPKVFVQEALNDLLDGDYTDAQIIFSIKDLKARNRDLTFTEIAKNMANAVNKMNNGLPPGVLTIKPAPAPEPVRRTPGKRVNDELKEMEAYYNAKREERERMLAQ